MAKKLSLRQRLLRSWKPRSLKRKMFDIVLVAFAAAGAAIIGAWAFYELGFTRNRGAYDRNNRSLMEISEIEAMRNGSMDSAALSSLWVSQYVRLAAFSHYYPVNARLILEGAQHSRNPYMVDRMLAAAEVYIEHPEDYRQLSERLAKTMQEIPQEQTPNVIPWMNSIEWASLKHAILRDSALINKAGALTGVEPRLIAGCLIGEQIRLFNSKREMFKKYLGPIKVLSVQSQFSFGVNGIKIPTAKAVEEHLKDPSSPFYMGKQYEDLLNYEDIEKQEEERYDRLVDYRNHLYSYIYTGCILHQTMLQWKRAGYDISDRPDILFTLFNVGFEQSKPKAEPVCGGSRIEVDGRHYTFGAIGFDFYYSGELADIFPYRAQSFVPDNGRPMSGEQVQEIQRSMSNSHQIQRRDSVASEERQSNMSSQKDQDEQSTLSDTSTLSVTPSLPY